MRSADQADEQRLLLGPSHSERHSPPRRGKGPGHGGKAVAAYLWGREWAGPENEKKRWKHERLGLKAQEPPDIDDVVVEVLEAYAHIGRSRQYVGMVGAPAPLAPAAIAEYLDRYPSAICREEFDAAIYALDDQFRRQWDEQQEKAQAEADRKARPIKR